MAEHGYYGAAQCGGPLAKSGKGGGARAHGQRYQLVMAFPSWDRANGSDVYFSSRWDATHQMYDHYYTSKNIGLWWTTKPWEWLFIQELPYNLTTEDFEWAQAKPFPTGKWLKNQKYRQKTKMRRKTKTQTPAF